MQAPIELRPIATPGQLSLNQQYQSSNNNVPCKEEKLYFDYF